jgi:hypothetical protein
MYLTVDIESVWLLLNKAKEMRELLIYEANCNKVQSDETVWEVRENNNIRRIAIEFYNKKDEANKSFIRALA